VDPAEVVAVALALGAGVLGLWFVGAVNGLVRLRGLVGDAWQQVDDELRRRHDLVPNLAAVVRDRVRGADDRVDAVLRARAAAVAASGPTAPGQTAVARVGAAGPWASGRTAGAPVAVRAPAERDLSRALDDLFAATRDHVSLRTDESYLALHRELTDAAARLTAERRLYNATVTRFNARLDTWPARFAARLLRLAPAEPFASVGADPRSAEFDLPAPPGG
jgi:LemA protein